MHMSFAYQMPRKCVQNKKRKHTKRQVLAKIIQRVYQHFNFECAYCGNEAESIDHIIPRHKGGDNSPNNLVAACIDCNHHKGTKFIEDWYTEANNTDWTEYRCQKIKAWRGLSK